MESNILAPPTEFTSQSLDVLSEDLLNDSQPEFIDRVNNPQNYPFIRNKDGSISTHRMAAEVDEDGNWYVFPMIQMNQETGELDVFEDDDYRKAMDNALKTNNFIKAPSKEFALDYAKGGYKTEALKEWGMVNSKGSVE